jgi:hypothetical protein
MGRHKQPEIRDRILDACVDHALVHGLPGRLEPFAASPRSPSVLARPGPRSAWTATI